jgi:hypothetical protein
MGRGARWAPWAGFAGCDFVTAARKGAAPGRSVCRQVGPLRCPGRRLRPPQEKGQCWRRMLSPLRSLPWGPGRVVEGLAASRMLSPPSTVCRWAAVGLVEGQQLAACGSGSGPGGGHGVPVGISRSKTTRAVHGCHIEDHRAAAAVLLDPVLARAPGDQGSSSLARISSSFRKSW